jgi:hypothetical protein
MNRQEVVSKPCVVVVTSGGGRGREQLYIKCFKIKEEEELRKKKKGFFRFLSLSQKTKGQCRGRLQ